MFENDVQTQLSFFDPQNPAFLAVLRGGLPATSRRGDGD